MNKKKIENSNFYSGLFRKFDKALITQIDRLSRTLNLAIDKVDKRLKSCEETMVYFIDCTNQKCETDLALAEVLVNKELRSKIVMSQWTNKFLATTNAEHLDPISFAFSRFSLNIALSFKEVDPRYLVKYKLHKHLVDYISQDSELVVGPALMALVHLSLFNELKGEIVAVGALPMLLKIMANSKSKTILTQAAKLCSSLALHRPNKTLMANSGCFHTLIDLILGAHTAINNHIQFFALSSVVNIVHNSDSNRMLAVELSAIKPTVTVLQTTTKEEILLEAVKVIANISYANGYCANCVLVAGGGEVMLEVLESGDVLKQPRIAHAILAAFSNICSTEVNQSHVGSIKGLVDCVIRICDYAKEVHTVTEAANFLIACCWKNTINKVRLANKNACLSLVRRLVTHQHTKTQDDLRCFERVSIALATILLYRSTHERMYTIGGLEEVIRLCKVLSEPLLLRSLAKIIITMIPNPKDLLRFHIDDNKYPVEKLNALSVLKKAKVKGYADTVSAPEWLERSIEVLSMTDSELEKATPFVKNEFVDGLSFSKEFSTEINPDATVYESTEFRSLLFSIY